MEKNKHPKKIETTGHKWDGIEEYNVPTPRWWLIVWVICEYLLEKHEVFLKA